MAWTECQSHLVSYGIMFLLFSNLLLFCSADYIHSWQLWDLLHLCLLQLYLPVFQHEFHLVSHKNICHSCLVHAAPLAIVLAYSIYSVTNSNKPNAALNREKSKQKTLSSFHFEYSFVEGIRQGCLLQTETNVHKY